MSDMKTQQALLRACLSSDHRNVEHLIDLGFFTSFEEDLGVSVEEFQNLYETKHVESLHLLDEVSDWLLDEIKAFPALQHALSLELKKADLYRIVLWLLDSEVQLEGVAVEYFDNLRMTGHEYEDAERRQETCESDLEEYDKTNLAKTLHAELLRKLLKD
jgi:hypothetical protein